MSFKHLLAGTSALLAASHATAGLPLGVAQLPLVEGGLFTVAVVALLAGVRIVRSKQKR